MSTDTKERAKTAWEKFKEGEPGHRFQDRYHERQRQSKGRWDASKILNVVGGLLLIPIGLVMVPAPGPGWIIVFFGAGLLGGESLPVAQFLDRTEVAARDVADWGLKTWKRMPLAAKAALILAVAAGAAALTYGAYLYWASR
jgi:uncharacterized protein (TIGR02611 family)